MCLCCSRIFCLFFADFLTLKTVKISKRAADSPMGNSEKQKRKCLSLLIAQKVELLEKLDRGVSVRHLTEDYGVGTTTVYDQKQQ